MNPHLITWHFKKPFYSWKNKYLKRIAHKEAQADESLAKAAEEVAQYLGQPPAEVLERYRRGNFQEKEFFTGPGRLSTDAVEQYYRKNKTYIYDLPLWNAEFNRPKFLHRVMRSKLKQCRCQSVLDFGGGCGDLCIELAQGGFQTVYFDLGEQVFDFAQRRFAQRKLAVEMFKDWRELGARQFDCVISFDVFEHIKDLPATLSRLCGFIKSGGLLIFSGAFSGGGAHLTENEVYADRKNMMRLLGEFGLEFLDQFNQYSFYKKR